MRKLFIIIGEICLVIITILAVDSLLGGLVGGVIWISGGSK